MSIQLRRSGRFPDDRSRRHPPLSRRFCRRRGQRRGGRRDVSYLRRAEPCRHPADRRPTPPRRSRSFPAISPRRLPIATTSSMSGAARWRWRVISAVGALAGALILLALDNPSFRALVPWLLIAATALFAAGPWLKPKPSRARMRHRRPRRSPGSGGPVRDRGLWRLLRRRHGRDDAGHARPDPGRRLSSAQRAQEPAGDRHRRGRHRGLRLRAASSPGRRRW